MSKDLNVFINNMPFCYALFWKFFMDAAISSSIHKYQKSKDSEVL